MSEKLKKVKKKKETNPDIRRYIDWFYREFYNRFGSNYFVTGKDMAIIQRLLGTFKYDDLIGLTIKFFESKDSFIQKAGYTVGVFSSQINKLTSTNGNGNVLSDKGMMTLQAGKTWIDEGFDECRKGR